MLMRARRTLLLASVALAVTGCSNSTAGDGGALPDFSLLDVNDTSATSGQRVSPRDVNVVSAWYFAHAT